ncbi:MAG: CDP-glycerol glycerophosphotransferase family protein [Chloroflexota bacterium]
MSDRPSDTPIELVSIHWVRVQVIVEGRLAGGIALDPSSFDLRLAGRDTRFPPTHADVEDGRITLRYNVMNGPGLDPMSAGRWTLAARVVGGDEAIDPVASTGAFQLADRLFTVRPIHDESRGTLSFDVSYDAEIRRLPDPSVGDRARWFVRQVAIQTRRLGFRLLVRSTGLFQRRRRRQVMFASNLISEMSGNLKAVHDRMIERGLDRTYDLVTILRPRAGESRGFLGRVALARALARSDVIMLDDSYPPLHWLKLGPKVRIIQMWHAAGAFKTVGYSRVGKPDEAERFARVHKDYAAAIVSSAHDIPFYAEAFGIPEDRVVPTGIPRMDRFFDERAKAAGLAAARAAFPETAGHLTVLYAPTFRGRGPTSASFDFEKVDYAALHAVAVEKDAIVIIKMHPFVREPLGIPQAFRDRLIDGSKSGLDVNDLLFAVDLLITDYSSIVFEFSTLRRPMLFYAYDLDDYIGSRDFYVPFESFVPGRIVRTFPELVDAIRRNDFELEKVGAFAETHFAYLDAGSSDRVIDQLILPFVSGGQR